MQTCINAKCKQQNDKKPNENTGTSPDTRR